MIKFDSYNSRLENLIFAIKLRSSATYQCYGPIQLVRDIRTKKLVVVESAISRSIKKLSSDPEFDWGKYSTSASGKTFMTDAVLPGDKFNLCYFCSPKNLVSFLETCPAVKHSDKEEHELIDSKHYRILVL